MAHLLALGPTYTRQERSGELVNTATEGVEALDAYFADYLPGLFNALLVPLLILVVVFPIDLWTWLVLFFTAPLIPFLMALIGIVAGLVARRQYGAMSRMSAHFLDVMQGLTTLKLFNRSRQQVGTIESITNQFRETTMKVLRVAFLSALTLEMLATLSIALVAVEIGVRLLNGGIPFTDALFLLVIAPDYYLPLRSLGAKFHAGTEGTAAAARIYEVLDTPLPDRPTGTPPGSLAIRFDDVHFAYGDRPALNGMHFDAPEGKITALVGPSGGGKSTVASLLLRFIEADGVFVGGVDLNTVDPDHWRERVAWVPQAPYLFNASVADNIRLGHPDAPLDAIMEAAWQAEAHGFINALPQGFETIVGERGARLSGGQAQRIAIARAFLRDAPLLILDEATANLDPETEAAIERSLRRLMAGRTVLVIAHRLSTVFNADHIVVVEGGRAAQQGDHTTLMADGGLYRQLVETYDATVI
jgi:ATP-binding cassette, subfamily C, bacterial CydD